jgi:hypothetical protein
MGGVCSTHERDENACKILVGKPEGRDHVEDIGIDGRMLLEWISRK